jgi:hypothetical protein
MIMSPLHIMAKSRVARSVSNRNRMPCFETKARRSALVSVDEAGRPVLAVKSGLFGI